MTIPAVPQAEGAVSCRRFTSITADQIRAAAGGANFGDSDPVRVVCRGLLQIAAGFRTGYTVQSILVGLKLVAPRSLTPTKLGRLFLFDLYCNADPLAALAQPTKESA